MYSLDAHALNMPQSLSCFVFFNQWNTFVTYTPTTSPTIAVLDVDAFGDLEWSSALNPVIISLALCIDTNPERVQEKTLSRQASLNIYCVWPPSTTHTTNTHRSLAFLPSIHACALQWQQQRRRWQWRRRRLDADADFLFIFPFVLLADNQRWWAGPRCVMMLNINVWRWLLR